MSWNEMIGWQGQNLIEILNPMGRAALVHGGDAVGQIQVAGSHGSLIREVNVHIAESVRRPRGHDFDGVVAKINRQFLRECFGGWAKHEFVARRPGGRWSGGGRGYRYGFFASERR